MAWLDPWGATPAGAPGKWTVYVDGVTNDDSADLSVSSAATGTTPASYSRAGSAAAVTVVPTLVDVAANGTFAADTGWTKGSGVTISGGKANWAASASGNLTAEIPPLVLGAYYKVSFYLVTTAGTIQVNGWGGTPTQYSTTGSKAELIGPCTSTAFYFDPVGTFQGTVDNLKIEMLEVWTIAVTADGEALNEIDLPWRNAGGATDRMFSTTTGKFFSTRLCGLEIDMTIAATVGVNFASSDLDWQGDESNQGFPGDNSFPGIGYDDGTRATWVGLLDKDIPVKLMFSKGRMQIAYQTAVADLATVTFRVLISQNATGANVRERIGRLVRMHGAVADRPTGRVGDEWRGKPGFIDVETQDESDPIGVANDVWDEWGERIGGMLCWGQMSDYGGSCCEQRNYLNPRNKELRVLSERIQDEGGLFGVYSIPITDGDPSAVESWLRCNSRWCNALYADTIGTLETTAALAYKNLMIENASLSYPHASLVSGALAGSSHADCQSGSSAAACLASGSFSPSKQATNTGSDNGYDSSDPGETRPNDESYPYSRWCKTAFWLGRAFADAGPFTSTPTRFFLGPENSDANYPAWNLTTCFMTGCGMAVRRQTLDDYGDVVELILDEWDDTGFLALDARFMDRIGLVLVTPSSGVDYRRFVTSDGSTWLAIDQNSLGLSSVTVTVDGATVVVPMTGRFKLYEVP